MKVRSVKDTVSFCAYLASNKFLKKSKKTRAILSICSCFGRYILFSFISYWFIFGYSNLKIIQYFKVSWIYLRRLGCSCKKTHIILDNSKKSWWHSFEYWLCSRKSFQKWFKIPIFSLLSYCGSFTQFFKWT